MIKPINANINTKVIIEQDGKPLTLAQFTHSKTITPHKPAKTNYTRKQLFTFRASGLGDAVMAQTLIRHYKAANPDCFVGVECVPGLEAIFKPVADATHTLLMPWVWRSEYPKPQDIFMARNEAWFSNLPSTKTTKAIRDMSLVPDTTLYYTEIEIEAEQEQRLQTFLDSLPANKPYGLVHFSGTAEPESKDLHICEAISLVDVFLRSNITPIILDWQNRYYNYFRIAANKAGYNPNNEPVFKDCIVLNNNHPLWKHEWVRGGADAGLIAGLIEKAKVLFGIDSGIEHLAQATNTDTIVFHHSKHPGRVFDPAPNLTHIFSEQHDKELLAENKTAHRYFKKHYKGETYKGDISDYIHSITGWLDE